MGERVLHSQRAILVQLAHSSLWLAGPLFVHSKLRTQSQASYDAALLLLMTDRKGCGHCLDHFLLFFLLELLELDLSLMADPEA